VIVPGEIELKKMEQQKETGILLDPAVLELLHHHAKGVPYA
jgi:LDH2 family malate/lactate/ureidoglycolate dehydrogenase